MKEAAVLNFAKHQTTFFWQSDWDHFCVLPQFGPPRTRTEMGRKCWPPIPSEHDIINNRATLKRKDAKAAPEYGYVDFARGGALHKEPPKLGHHPLTKKNETLTLHTHPNANGVGSSIFPNSVWALQLPRSRWRSLQRDVDCRAR